MLKHEVLSVQGMPALRGLRYQTLGTAGFFPNQLSGAVSVDPMDHSRITELALAQLATQGAHLLCAHMSCHCRTNIYRVSRDSNAWLLFRPDEECPKIRIGKTRLHVACSTGQC